MSASSNIYNVLSKYSELISRLSNFAVTAKSSFDIDNSPNGLFTGNKGDILLKNKNLIYYKEVNSNQFILLSSNYEKLTEQYKDVLSKGINTYATWTMGDYGWLLNGYYTQYADINCCTVTDSINSSLIYWKTPDPIIYGTPLSQDQLNATSPIPGTFVYSPTYGKVLNGGTNTLTVFFTPTDTTNYSSATGSVNLVVNKITASDAYAITWNNPEEIEYGTRLSAAQLNAVAKYNGVPIEGKYQYYPGFGAILPAANDYQLKVIFTPTAIHNYESLSKTVTIDITKADSSKYLKWEPNPLNEIEVNNTLEGSLTAYAINGLRGTFTYKIGNEEVSPSTTRGVGTYDITALFEPGSNFINNFETASISNSITVTHKKYNLTWTPTPLTDLVAGDCLSTYPIAYDSNENIIDGTFSYSISYDNSIYTAFDPANDTFSCGNAKISAIFTPTDSDIYATSTISNSINININSIYELSWDNIEEIEYGTNLTDKLNANATYNETEITGTYEYSEISFGQCGVKTTITEDTILSVGTHYLECKFIPNDTENYFPKYISQTVNVNKNSEYDINWDYPAEIYSWTPLSAVQLNAVVNEQLPGGVTYEYDPDFGTRLENTSDAWWQIILLNVRVIPTDKNYSEKTKSVPISVRTNNVYCIAYTHNTNIEKDYGGTLTAEDLEAKATYNDDEISGGKFIYKAYKEHDTLIDEDVKAGTVLPVGIGKIKCFFIKTGYADNIFAEKSYTINSVPLSLEWDTSNDNLISFSDRGKFSQENIEQTINSWKNNVTVPQNVDGEISFEVGGIPIGENNPGIQETPGIYEVTCKFTPNDNNNYATISIKKSICISEFSFGKDNNNNDLTITGYRNDISNEDISSEREINISDAIVVTDPDSTTYTYNIIAIANNAFYDDSNGVLSSINKISFGSETAQDNIRSIGNNAFSGLTSLTKFYSKCNDNPIIFPNLSSIGRNPFENCANLAIPPISSSVYTIIDNCLYKTKENATTPVSLITYFESRSNNTSEYIAPSTVTLIKNHAFTGKNSRLEYIAFAGNIEFETTESFYKFKTLDGVNGVKVIYFIGHTGGNTYDGINNIIKEGITTVYYNEDTRIQGLQAQDYYKFEDNTEFKCVKNYDNFTGKSGDCNAQLNNSVSNVYCLEKYSSINSTYHMVIPPVLSIDGEYHFITAIDNNVFYNKEDILSAHVPYGITYIGNTVFFNNKNLISIELPTTITMLSQLNPTESYAVDNNNCYNAIKQSTFGFCYNNPILKSITMYPSNLTSECNYKTENGILFYHDSTVKSLIVFPNSGSVVFPDSDTSNTTYTVPRNCNRIEYGAFYNNTTLTNIEFDTTTESILKYIGGFAFYNLKNVKYNSSFDLNLPPNLEVLGNNAFGHSAITSVNIPSSVIIIGNLMEDESMNNLYYIVNPFTDCKYLETITISGDAKELYEGVYYGYKFDTENKVLYGVSGSTTDANSKNLVIHRIINEEEPYTVPSSVKSIAAYGLSYQHMTEKLSFDSESVASNLDIYSIYNNIHIQEINVPSHVSKIKDSAMSLNNNVENIFFENSNELTAIKIGAFQYDYSLQTITISSGVTSIGDYILRGCNSLRTIYALGDAPLDSEGQLKLGNAFADMHLTGSNSRTECLDKVTLYYSDTATGWSSLSNLNLQPFKITSGFDEDNIESNGLYYYIGDGDTITICGCSEDLTGSVVIPATIEGKDVTEIAKYAFSGRRISDISIPSTVTSIGEYAFEGCHNLTAYNITGEEEDLLTSTYIVEDGILYKKINDSNTDNKELFSYPSGLEAEIYTINSNVTKIHESAFAGCDKLKKIIIPNTIENIVDNFIYKCLNLKEIVIGNVDVNSNAGVDVNNDDVYEYRVVDNVLYEKLGNESTWAVKYFPSNRDILYYTIPEQIDNVDVTTINTGAICWTRLFTLIISKNIAYLKDKSVIVNQNLYNIIFDQENQPLFDPNWYFRFDNCKSNAYYNNLNWGGKNIIINIGNLAVNPIYRSKNIDTNTDTDITNTYWFTANKSGTANLISCTNQDINNNILYISSSYKDNNNNSYNLVSIESYALCFRNMNAETILKIENPNQVNNGENTTKLTIKSLALYGTWQAKGFYINYNTEPEVESRGFYGFGTTRRTDPVSQEIVEIGTFVYKPTTNAWSSQKLDGLIVDVWSNNSNN